MKSEGMILRGMRKSKWSGNIQRAIWYEEGLYQSASWNHHYRKTRPSFPLFLRFLRTACNNSVLANNNIVVWYVWYNKKLFFRAPKVGSQRKVTSQTHAQNHINSPIPSSLFRSQLPRRELRDHRFWKLGLGGRRMRLVWRWWCWWEYSPDW